MRKHVTIVAPHPDDEVIGCWEVLKKSRYSSILYVEKVSPEREKDSLDISDLFSVCSFGLYKGDYDRLREDIDKIQSDSKLYFPDPHFETHPAHRAIGAIGEEFLRKGFDVVFYSTNMLAPYIHEVKNPKAKLWDLERLYSSEKSLWEYDHKYFLFEGYCKWIL